MPSTTVGTIAPAAVVLAGERPGALYPLDAVGSGGGVASGIASSGSSSASSSSSSPPPPLLLPLAGAPLISYPLRALEASGVRRIIIVSSFADAEREKERERETETESIRCSTGRRRRSRGDIFFFFLSPLFDLFLLSPSPLRVNHPQVVNGDAAASKVSSWASKAYPSSSSSPSSSSPSPSPPAVSVVAAPEDASTADALALALPLLGDAASTPAFLCVPGDLVTDVSFGPAVLRHFVSGAGVTALLARARASPAAASGGAGKAPRGADLLSVDRESSRLLFSCPSPRPPRLGEDASCATTAVRGSGSGSGAAANGGGGGGGGVGGGEGRGGAGAATETVTQSAQLAPAPRPPRELRVPPSALASFPNLEIRSDLIDVGCYVFDTETVAAALEKGRGGRGGERGDASSSGGYFAGLSLREDVVPYLVRKQFSASSPSSPYSAAEDLLAYPAEATARSRGSGSGDGGGGLDRADSVTPPPPAEPAAAAPLAAGGRDGGGGGGGAGAAGAAPTSRRDGPPSLSASPPPPAVAAAAARRGAAAARRRALRRPARAFVLPRGALCLRAARGGAPSFLDAAREIAAAAASVEAAAGGGDSAAAGGAQDERAQGLGGDAAPPPPAPSCSSSPSSSSASSLLPPEALPTFHPTATVAPKAAVALGCLLGAGTAVGDRASVKRSALGARCRVARSARVVGCVLGDGVSIGEGAALQNCAVAAGASVGARASLKECFVGPEVQVAEEFAAKEEVLVSAAGAAAAAARARGGGGAGGGAAAASGGVGSHASDQFTFGSSFGSL